MSDRKDEERLPMLELLREELPDDGFSARLHQRLVAAGAPRPLGAFERARAFLRDNVSWKAALTGAVAGLLAFVLLEAAYPRSSARVPAPGPLAASEPARVACEPAAEVHAEVFVLPAGKVARVQLEFAVEHAVEQAEFSVLLPEGLSFYSQGEELAQRSFQWTAPLASGSNSIPIAVVGKRAGRHTLAAAATIGDEVVVHEVVLDVQEAG